MKRNHEEVAAPNNGVAELRPPGVPRKLGGGNPRRHRLLGLLAFGLCSLSARADWTPLVVHPVKDRATERMLHQAAGENDPVVQELSAEALALIAGRSLPVLLVPGLPATELARLAVALRQAAQAQRELILANLHAPAVVAREEAVRAAQRARLTQAVPALLPLLEDPDEGIRLATVEALQVLRPVPEEKAIFEGLVHRLDHELSFQVCQNAVRVLNRWHSPTAQAALLGFLAHGSVLVRLAAVPGLVEWNDPALAPQLDPLLADEDLSVAIATAQALEKLANPASRRPLRERLPAAPAAVQEKIIHALGELGATEVIKDLLPLVNREPDGVSAAAAQALGKLKAVQVIPLLRKPLETVTAGAAGTRREAIRALRVLGERETGGPIWRIVTQPVVPTPMGPVLDATDVREEGLRYLTATGDQRYVAALISVAGNAQTRLEMIILVACQTVVDLGGARQLPDLVGHLSGTPAAEIRPALCAILEANTGRHYEPLPDQSHRRYFVETLGPPPYPAIPKPPGVVAVVGVEKPE